MVRSVPVCGYASLAHLSAAALSPALEALDDDELEVLRCRHLDYRLLANVLGRSHPIDTLASPEGRMRAIASYLPEDATVLGPSALWVHTGGDCPRQLSVAGTGRARSRWRTIDTYRTCLPRTDTVVIAGRKCATLARACVDTARLAPPLTAVRAVMQARDLGVSRVALFLALSHCRGSAATGRPRAQRIIDALLPERVLPEKVPGEQVRAARCGMSDECQEVPVPAP